MGNFYTNYTLRGPTQNEVAAALTGRNAVVAPQRNGCVVVFDEQSDEQDMGRITELASQLSRTLRCPVLAILNHDDDVLWYQLHESGDLSDEYNSSPGYFGEPAESSDPAGGDARKLCAAFSAANIEVVEAILRKPSCDPEGYVFAFDRHADLVCALGLPEFVVGTAFSSFDHDEYPESITSEDIVRTV